MDSLKHRLDLALDAAREAGRVTLRYFQSTIPVELKADRSPVTQADREAEDLLFTLLRRDFPADAFVGEERGERPGSSGWRWIVDPIDGTRSFIQGVPLYGVMVALEERGEPVLGVVHLPALGEIVAAARGEGCRWNGSRARVSEVETLAQACVVYTGLESFDDAPRRATLERVRSRARVVRGWGDCYGHILVATGRAEIMLDPVLSEWDCAALLPILEEAGGTFTDWEGRRTTGGKSGISSNGKLGADIRALLAG